MLYSAIDCIVSPIVLRDLPLCFFNFLYAKRSVIFIYAWVDTYSIRSYWEVKDCGFVYFRYAVRYLPRLLKLAVLKSNVHYLITTYTDGDRIIRRKRPRPSLQKVWKLETSRPIAQFPTCLPFPSSLIKSKLSKCGLHQACHHCGDSAVVCRPPLLATMFAQRISCCLQFVYHMATRRAYGVSEAGSPSVLRWKAEKCILSWADRRAVLNHNFAVFCPEL
jgi:hypothetical protein